MYNGNAAANIEAEKKPLLGRVKWFNNQKGYGFIVHETDPDIFVHHSAIQMEGYRTLKQDEVVQFELVSTSKGLQAVNVTRGP